MLKEEKRLLRRCIADKKKMYTNHELATYSTLLLSKLERHPLFAEAQTILMYYSLPDEVQTHDFIEKWVIVWEEERDITTDCLSNLMHIK